MQAHGLDEVQKDRSIRVIAHSSGSIVDALAVLTVSRTLRKTSLRFQDHFCRQAPPFSVSLCARRFDYHRLEASAVPLWFVHAIIVRPLLGDFWMNTIDAQRHDLGV